MSVSSDFDDPVKICEFYSDEDLPIEVDYENYYVNLGSYVIDPVMENGCLVMYLVEEPDGTTLFVSDLDDYFQSQFVDSWEDR